MMTSCVYTSDELAKLDLEYQFGCQSREEDLYVKCAASLSFENMTKHCCLVCDCGHVKASLMYVRSGPYVANLCRVLKIDEDVLNALDPYLVSQYNVKDFDEKLAGLLLSQSGFYVEANDMYHP
ncbi:hypothetical protein HDU78_011025, partial [Chytriomyces hyalinus]